MIREPETKALKMIALQCTVTWGLGPKLRIVAGPCSCVASLGAQNMSW